MMKNIFAFIFMVCLCGGVKAQESIKSDAASDTLLFRQLHLNNRISPSSNIAIFSKLYKYLLGVGQREQPALSDVGPIVTGIINYERKPGDFYPDFHFQNYDSEYERLLYTGGSSTFRGVALIRNVSFYQCRDSLLKAFEAQNTTMEARQAEMEDLIKRLELFSAKVQTKPLFFVDIQTKFKGNIRKYVKNLYKKSMMSNYDRLTDFLKKPRLKKIQTDPGVQMSISLALYELWIKDVREGRVK